MENATRNGMRRWLGSDPWPKLFAVVTVATCGGAYALLNVRPWGAWCAATLIASWAAFVMLYSVRQARLEGRPGADLTFRERFARRPAAIILRIFMAVVLFAIAGTTLWLDRVGAPLAQTTLVNAAFWAVMLCSWIVEIVVDSIYGHFERRRLIADQA